MTSRSVRSILAALSLAGLWAPAFGGCGSSGGSSADAGSESGPAEAGTLVLDGPRLGPDAAAPVDEAGSTSTCAAFAAYSMCNTSDLCAPMYAEDCDSFDALYTLAGRQAVTACYGTPAACSATDGTQSCMFTKALAAKRDATQQKLAADFCKACPSGDAACATDFYVDNSAEAGTVGIGAVLWLALMNDTTIARIDKTCVTGLAAGAGGDGGQTCTDLFTQCASTLVTPVACNPSADGGGDATGP